MDGFSQVGERHVVGRYGNFVHTLTGLAVDLRRCPVFLDCGEFLHFHHCTGGGVDGEFVDFVQRIAVFLAETDADVILVAVLFEVAGGVAVDFVADV